MRNSRRNGWLVLGTAIMLAACGPSETATGPAEINAETACALDGMLLSEYGGPKAQIHYEGEPEALFFCDTIEMFSLYLKPEQVRKIRALYVQDMGKTAWDNPQGAWIDAQTAFFVVGSKKHGSMGPTFASFAMEQDAQRFLQTHGGAVYRFDAITPAMVSLDGGALHDHSAM